MKKIPAWLLILIFIMVLIASKFIFFSNNKDEKSAKGPAKGKGPVAVNYYVVQPATFINEVFATGKTGALNQVEILPEVNGKITGIYFREGEMVNKGDLLIKLNDADLQAQLQKTRTQTRLSGQKLERLKKLLEVKGISQEEFDMQENELEALKADEAFISAQIAKTSITAPFSGIVGLENVSLGSFVSATTPIVSLVQMKPIFVEFSIPEKYNAFFRKGLKIEFSRDNAETAKSYTATVYAIEPRVDETTRTIKARAMYEGDQLFYPGSFVHVYLNLGKTENALMVPGHAVIPTLKGQKVYVSRNLSAAEVPVKTGVRTDASIQVLEGLKAGDTVITTGLMSVKKDSKLILLKPAP